MAQAVPLSQAITATARRAASVSIPCLGSAQAAGPTRASNA